MESKPFYIICDIDEGDDGEIKVTLKDMVRKIRSEYLDKTVKEFAKDMEYIESNYKKYEDKKAKMNVSFTLIRKICKRYGLKCELKIYRD